MAYALTQASIFDGKSWLEQHAILIKGNSIEAILPASKLPKDIREFSFPNKIICAGFIDLQLNGCGGVMLNGNFTEQTLAKMHQTNLRSGTTAFLPTLITCESGEVKLAIKTLRHYLQDNKHSVLGLHLEGPHLSIAKKGIHRADYIRPMNNDDLAYLIDNRDVITKITLAPEAVSCQQIKQLNQSGILVSIGHSNASYEQCLNAIQSGAHFATHLFNAMSPFEGRSPGCVGAVLDSQDVYAGIIADGLHVDFNSIRIAKRLLGEHLCLVTDATAAAGASITEFDFVGSKINVQHGRCYGSDGTLAGSSLTMDQGIRNLVDQVGVELSEAIRMASLYPARAIGLEDRMGAIRPGFIANLTILDSHMQVATTISQGELSIF